MVYQDRMVEGRRNIYAKEIGGGDEDIFQGEIIGCWRDEGIGERKKMG